MNNTGLARALAVVGLLVAYPSGAIAEPTNVTDYPLVSVTDKIYVIYGPFDLPNRKNHGFRNNPVIVLTDAGAVVFDPGGSAWAGEMVAEKIKAIGGAPIVAVFNSHAHGDHWLGNEGIRRVYPHVAIYGHPAMKERVAGPEGEFWLTQIEQLTQGAAGGKQVIAPDRIVNDGDIITIGDTSFRIFHTGSAHTDSDIMIEIVGQNALFTGDIVRNGLLGIMEADASFTGNIAAIDVILNRHFRYYIPGHGPVGGPEIVQNYRTYLNTLLSTARELYAQQKADYEMKPAATNALSTYKNWAGFDMRLGPHLSRAYLEIEMESF